MDTKIIGILSLLYTMIAVLVVWCIEYYDKI